MSTMEERFDRIDASIHSVSESIQGLRRFTLDLRDETASRLQVIESRLDLLTAAVTNIDARLPSLTKAALDVGAL